ncbi:MAG: hypothetical protein R3F11_17580 [Verrucomicrobiales bacterium]
MNCAPNYSGLPIFARGSPRLDSLRKYSFGHPSISFGDPSFEIDANSLPDGGITLLQLLGAKPIGDLDFLRSVWREGETSPDLRSPQRSSRAKAATPIPPMLIDFVEFKPSREGVASGFNHRETALLDHHLQREVVLMMARDGEPINAILNRSFGNNAQMNHFKLCDQGRPSI